MPTTLFNKRQLLRGIILTVVFGLLVMAAPLTAQAQEANFGYKVDGLRVSFDVISEFVDNDPITYSWDFGNDGTREAIGRFVPHTFDEAGVVETRLSISHNDGRPIDSIVKSFMVGPDQQYADSDGDGVPDDEDNIDNRFDDDDDGIPNDIDECPQDPTNQCDPPDPDDDGGNSDDDQDEATGGLVNCVDNCDWEKFIELINDLISWLIGLATAIATLLFMYAGFLYLTAGGNQSQADQAKTIFSNVAAGFGIILIAWLVITTIVSLLTSDDWVEENQELLPVDLSVEYSLDIPPYVS